MWSAARSAKISMILCMPERVSGGDAKFQGFCDGWNKWEGQANGLAVANSITVYCGKSWVTFHGWIEIANVKMDSRGFRIRKSEVITVTADTPNGTFIVMVQSRVDPKGSVIYFVSFEDYAKIIECLD